MADDGQRAAQPKAWTGRSRGGRLGHALVHGFARVLGRRGCYAMLIPPTTVYFLREDSARRAIMGFWRRLRPGLSREAAAWMAWRHFFAFARILADRFLLAAKPGSITFRNPGAARLDAAMRHPQGCIMLSAHVGAWELAGRWLTVHPDARINIVMLKAEDPAVQAEVERALGSHPFGIIDLRDPFAASLEIAAALRRGETCCMLGDRTAGSAQNAVAVPFLGEPASFPTGPFIAAAATGAVIVPTFALKEGPGSYVLDADEPWTLAFSSRAARARELEAAVARWAQRLERVVRAHPLQWQNFFDFWRKGPG
jgi:predicted LPLAT superfamily acyltransferase